MFTHVLDHAGNTVFAKDLAADPGILPDAVAPYRPAGLVVGCERFLGRDLLDKPKEKECDLSDRPTLPSAPSS